ncbi:MAG: conjugal transfer protein TrbF [Planctomycetota bacterium]|jgi:type IV secretion system protein VirB5|nr:conjugal transfer protein TrbF [Planctomycetota bacterium]
MNWLAGWRRQREDDRRLEENPYLAARRDWNDRMAELAHSRRMWQAAALSCLLLALGALAGLIHFAGRSAFIPYVVEVDGPGRALAVRRADRAEPADERVLRAALAGFVEDLRTVSFDRNLQNAAIWRVYAHLQAGDPATAKVTDYYRDPLTSPLRRAEERSTGVEISSVLRQTPDTWEVVWRERVWDRQGVRQEESRLRALASVYLVAPTSATGEDELRKNPLGIFIRDLMWAKVN